VRREKERKERNKYRKMGEMVGDQTVNQAAKPLKKGEKNKSPVLEQ
jgi:hypothetical protein